MATFRIHHKVVNRTSDSRLNSLGSQTTWKYVWWTKAKQRMLHEAVFIVDSPWVVRSTAGNQEGFELRPSHPYVTAVGDTQLRTYKVQRLRTIKSFLCRKNYKQVQMSSQLFSSFSLVSLWNRVFKKIGRVNQIQYTCILLCPVSLIYQILDAEVKHR